MNKKKSFFGSSILLVTAIIWGSAFGAQSKGMDYLGPFSFNGIRSIIAVIFLSAVLLFIVIKNKKNPDFKLFKNNKGFSRVSKRSLISRKHCSVLSGLNGKTNKVSPSSLSG